MFNKDVFRLLQSKKYPIVNVGDSLTTIFCINFCVEHSDSFEYPHSVVAHLLSLSCRSRSIDVPNLLRLVLKCVDLGWRPYRADASYYEKICINKIVDFIDNYEKKNH